MRRMHERTDKHVRFMGLAITITLVRAARRVFSAPFHIRIRLGIESEMGNLNACPSLFLVTMHMDGLDALRSNRGLHRV